MKDNEKLFLEWVEHIDIDRDSIPENSVSNIKKQIHKTLENKKGNSKPKLIYRSKVAVFLLVVIGTLATVGIVDAAIKYIKGTVLYNKDLDSIINDTPLIEPEGIVKQSDTLMNQLIINDTNNCIDPSTVDIFIDTVTELALNGSESEYALPSFVFDAQNMTVFTNDYDGWDLDPGDIVILKYQIDPNLGNSDGAGEIMHIGYIQDKNYKCIKTDKNNNFEVKFEVEKSGNYKFSLYNAGVSYIKVDSGSLNIVHKK